MANLYKGKYAIGVYDEDDEWLLTVVDNTREFARWLGVSHPKAVTIASKNFSGRHSSVIKDGRRFRLHFFAICD